MKETSSALNNLIVGCVTIIAIFVVGLFIFGELFFLEERNYMDITSSDYGKGWVWLKEDGSEEEITVPVQLDIEPSVRKITIKKIIDANPNKDLYLSFNTSKHDIVAFVDGKIRYTYSTKSTRPFGHSSADINSFIPIYSTDQGKELIIVMTSDNNYTGVISEMTLGTQGAIIYKVLSNEKISVVGSFSLMFMGLLSIMLGIFVRATYKEHISITFLGMGVFFAGFWMIAESEFRQFLVPNFSLLSNMTYLSIMVIPMCFALYFDSIQEHRYRLPYTLICMFSIVEAIIAMMLQFGGMVDLVNSLIYSFVLIVADVLVFAVTLLADLFSGKIKAYIVEAIGLIGAALAGVLTIVSYWNRPTHVNGNILGVGFLFAVIMAYTKAFGQVLSMEREVNAAKQAQVANSYFLSRMSNEMSTPINAILGMNKMILKESKNPEILEYARDVNGAGNYMLSIINEIQDLVKMNTGDIEIENQEYDLMDMVRECYALIAPRAKASRLSFSVRVDDILPSRISGDKDRVVYMITTLLSNSVTYTAEGNVSLDISGKIREGKLMLVVSISDTGNGMPPEVIATVFGKDSKPYDIHDGQMESSGIGLSLTKHIVDKMGGKIEAQSTLGKGTTVSFIIPQGICSTEPCGFFSVDPGRDLQTIDKVETVQFTGRILVVDDVAINVRVFEMFLKNSGLKIESAKSGVETLEKVCHTKYDLIFLDQFMPGMDGFEVKRSMNNLIDSLNKETPVILQVDNSNKKVVEDNPEYGFAGYITKPIKEEALLAILNKYFI